MRIKKRRGIFYTPSDLAAALAAWSIRSANDFALEPSFGGCGFISALRARFVSLGNQSPLENIYGCDVDDAALTRHFPQSVGGVADKRHFLKADFLSLTPRDFGRRKFTAVIGNPPYVSYHNMYRTQRVAVAAIRSDEWFQVSGMASLWAHFVFHAMRFVDVGGRMAWVLPGSLLHSDYAKQLLHELSMRFVTVTVISLGERVFADDGVSESTEVLLCEGLRDARQPGQVEVTTAENVESCTALLESWSTKQWSGHRLNGRAVPALVGEPELAAFLKIACGPEVTRLGEIAKLRIGIVTGANRLFIINEKTAREYLLPDEALRPILAKFAVAPGMQLMSADLKRARKQQARCLLVDRDKAPYSKRVQMYFNTFPVTARETNVTFKKYSDWRCPDDGDVPDAFFPYMHHEGPRLVLNSANVNATNTIHRVYFNDDLSLSQRKFAALSLLSTFSQVSAELEGRSYGGGVLKHEPSEARRIRFVMPPAFDGDDAHRLFALVDRLMRAGRAEEARRLVDDEIFSAMANPISHVDRKKLEGTLKALRSRRHFRRDEINKFS